MTRPFRGRVIRVAARVFLKEDGMRFSRCLRSVMRAAAVAVVVSTAVTTMAHARPRPKPGQGFRLFSSALTIIEANRVQCRVSSDGQLCATGSSTVGGGIWPKGTADQYIFAGGLQIAGVVDPTQSKSTNGFAGDTAGAFFYNTSGTSNGTALRPIFSSVDPADAAAWPVEARVPCSDPATTTIVGGLPPETIARCDSAGVGGDPTGDLFDPALQGSISASQGDHWLLYWEGDPANLASRKHPLGILVETRALAWNFPTGNEDILYFVFTFYNVTSARPDDYLGIRSSIRPFIQQKGKDFQALNTAKFGVPLPEAGYLIKDIFVDVVNDMDVANFNANYSGVDAPFQLGYTYENDFSQSAALSLGWTFDPAIFGSAPFFPGVGFAGVKYLKSPTNPATGQQVGLSIFGTFSNSVGSLTDPNDDKQLYRYMTGHLLPTDGACSLNPDVSHICSVNLDSPTDMRFYQSSGPFDLAPGQFGSIVAAYVFAPPVADGNCPGPACNVKAADGGDPNRLTILGDAARMAGGVNQVDRMTGYTGFDDVNGDGVVTQKEIKFVPGSLLGKAQVAQDVFDTRFLLPFSPVAPPFFLVPGNNQVTVLWSPSATETTPDPFFVVASNPLKADGTVNSLYDPNFRGLDVEGYRIYRGRTSNPSQLTLIAQYDYAPDPATGKGIYNDFRGVVNPDPGCAPELGITTSCPVAFETPPPGTAFTVSNPVDLVGTVTQVKATGGRVKLADSTAQILPGALDTAFIDITRGTRIATGVTTALANTGVPFIFTDKTARNSVRYFYTVTAFDINSFTSGLTSLESGRIAKPVTPVALPSNVTSSDSTSTGIFGRGVERTPGAVPSLDPTTGIFSGPFPPADGWTIGLQGVVAQILSGENQVSATLDSIQLGSPYQGIPHQYFFTASASGTSATVTLPVLQPEETGVTEADGGFLAVAPDENLAKPFGGSSAIKLAAKVGTSLPGPDYLALYGRGCINNRPGFGTLGACAYNGSRWFAGPSPQNNETQADPIACNTANGSGTPMTCYNNAGALPGVTTIYNTQCYQAAAGNGCRQVAGIQSGAKRGADFNLYWGTAGVIDSVIDVTHNVVVPFDSIAAGTWGILNASATAVGPGLDGSAVLTNADFACVEPFRTFQAGALLCPAGTVPYRLSNTAVPGQVGFFSGGAYPPVVPIVTAANPGFALYIAGDMFTFELTAGALPAAGTVWSLRQYVGAITGGHGAAGDLGPYAYSNPEGVLPLTAVGAELRTTITVNNSVAAAVKGDLTQVHTVPDPYYVRSKFESSTDQKILKFVGLPRDAIIRIYSASGVLVRILEHHAGNYDPTSTSQGSEIQWDLRNRNNQVVASGVYFYHVEAGDARRVGRFTVVNFAQ
jgi:hypothetical protein